MHVKYTGLTKQAARTLEQLLISSYEINNLKNARREIKRGNLTGFAHEIGNMADLFFNVTRDGLLSLMER